MVTSTTSALKRADAAFAVLGIAVVALTGFFVGVHGLQALLLVALGAVVLLIMLKPLYGMLLMAASIPMQAMFLVGESVTATRMLGVLVAGAWVLQKLLRGEAWGPLVRTPVLVTGALFVGYALASLLWALHPRVIPGGFVQLVQLLLWAAIIIDLAGSWRRADLLVRALVFGALLAAAFTFQQYYTGAYRRAGEGIAGGINSTAVVLVTLMPFGFYLFRTTVSLLWRSLGFAYVTIGSLAIAVTFSRMNMLLLPPLLLVLLAETIWSGRGRRWALGLGAAMFAAGIYAVPWDLVTERAETIAPYVETTIEHGTSVQPAASGRGYHLKVGLAIFRDHPIFGAGYLNYGHLFLNRYQFEVPGSPKTFTTPRSPHSSHVGILADLGLIGSLLWIAMLGSVLYACYRGWRATRRDGWSDRHIFVRAVTYAVLLQIFAYGMYLPSQREKIFWTVLATAVVAANLARGKTWRRAAEDDAPDADAPAPEPAMAGAGRARAGFAGTYRRGRRLDPEPSAPVGEA